MIYIKCPVSGINLSTGIEVKDIITEKSRRHETPCYYCEGFHFWNADDVNLPSSDELKFEL